MIKLNVLLLVVATSILMGSCKSTQKLSDVTKAEEIEIPFSDAKYKTDKDFFRAVQTGISPDLATSKKIALQNAKTELASNIQTIIKAVTDNYTNQRTVNDKQEFESKFEELSRQVTNQQLIDVKVIGEKSYKEVDGRYSFWIAIEMSKDVLLENFQNQIPKDEKLKLDFDKYMYEKILEQEMGKFSNR